MIGPQARMLGVRPGPPPNDIPVHNGLVQPNTGGMSVAPDRPENLPFFRRPPQYGGTGKDPVWFLPISLLGADLIYVQDRSDHGLVEPARTMTLDEYQQALAQTAPSWGRLP